MLALGVAWPALLALIIKLADRSRGGPLASFVEEYAGGGSCKLRSDAAFEALLLLGLTGFPVAFATAAMCAFRRAWLGSAAALAGALALGMLGFLQPALGICP